MQHSLQAFLSVAHHLPAQEACPVCGLAVKSCGGERRLVLAAQEVSTDWACWLTSNFKSRPTTCKRKKCGQHGPAANSSNSENCLTCASARDVSRALACCEVKLFLKTAIPGKRCRYVREGPAASTAAHLGTARTRRRCRCLTRSPPGSPWPVVTPRLMMPTCSVHFIVVICFQPLFPLECLWQTLQVLI